MRTSARVAFLVALGILLLLTTGLRATVAADAAAEPVVARITVRSPAELERTYYLLACADDRNSVAEADEGNNCAAASRRLTIGP